jgi:hypothetical protein
MMDDGWMYGCDDGYGVRINKKKDDETRREDEEGNR